MTKLTLLEIETALDTNKLYMLGPKQVDQPRIKYLLIRNGPTENPLTNLTQDVWRVPVEWEKGFSFITKVNATTRDFEIIA